MTTIQNKKIKLLTLAFSICQVAVFSVNSNLMPRALAQLSPSPQAMAAISQLEQQLFLQEYGDQDLNARLSRLEKRLYGQVSNDPIDKRVADVQDALKSKEKSVEELTGVSASSTNKVAKNERSGNKTTQNPKASNKYQSKEMPTEEECAIQRARVAMKVQEQEQVSNLLGEGVNFWRSGQRHLAIEKFEQVLKLDAGNAEANFSMGIVEESQGNYIQALGFYKKAIASKPDRNEYAEAAKAVETKLRAVNNFGQREAQMRVLAQNGTLAYKKGDYLAALKHYTELDKLAPNQALTKFNLATVHYALGEIDNSHAMFQEAHRLAPDEAAYKNALMQLEASMHVRYQQAQIQGHQAEYQGPASAIERQSMLGAVLNNGPMKLGGPNQAQPFASRYGFYAKTAAGQGVKISMIGINSKASKAGLQKGDLIKFVNGRAVGNVNDVTKLLSKFPGQSVELVIQRGTNTGKVVL